MEMRHNEELMAKNGELHVKIAELQNRIEQITAKETAMKLKYRNLRQQINGECSQSAIGDDRGLKTEPQSAEIIATDADSLIMSLSTATSEQDDFELKSEVTIDGFVLTMVDTEGQFDERMQIFDNTDCPREKENDYHADSMPSKQSTLPNDDGEPANSEQATTNRNRVQLIRAQRKGTHNKPYSCKVCGNQFRRRINLDKHVAGHEKRFRCDLCGKRYGHSQSLKIHRRSHTGERPYSCDVCGQHFTTFHSRKEHMNIHTGERPYSCGNCGKTYARSCSLRKHRHHGCEMAWLCASRLSSVSTVRNDLRIRLDNGSSHNTIEYPFI